MTQGRYRLYGELPFDCSRYIVMNPVAANRVKHPAEYRWSSYRANAFGETNELITQHEVYKRIGICEASRREGYARLFDAAIDPDDVRRIQSAASCSMPLGDSRFKQQIETALKRKVGYEQRGRLRKSETS